MSDETSFPQADHERRITQLENQYMEEHRKSKELETRCRQNEEHIAMLVELDTKFQEMLSERSQTPKPQAPIAVVTPRFRFATIESPVEEIEKIFYCYDGDHAPYHLDMVGEKWLYHTIAFTRVGEDYSLERLYEAMFENFLKLRARCVVMDRPVLYWRYAKESRFGVEGPLTINARPSHYKIRTRVAIPWIQQFSTWPLSLHTPDGETFPKIP